MGESTYRTEGNRAHASWLGGGTTGSMSKERKRRERIGVGIKHGIFCATPSIDEIEKNVESELRVTMNGRNLGRLAWMSHTHPRAWGPPATDSGVPLTPFFLSSPLLSSSVQSVQLDGDEKREGRGRGVRSIVALASENEPWAGMGNSPKRHLP